MYKMSQDSSPLFVPSSQPTIFTHHPSIKKDMSPAHNRSYCCFCIPFRLAVAILSVLALALGGASLWTVMHAGITDSTSKIAAYVATGVYGLLGVSGLVAVIFKHHALAKNFSVLWWTVTILVTILSVVNLVLFATREKDEVKAICQTNLLGDNKYPAGQYDPATLADDVDSCYKYVLIAAGASMAVQVLVMMLGGWIASRYTSEVKHRKDGMSYTYAQGYAAVEPLPHPHGQQAPPYQPAHPYTNIGGKGEWH